MIPYIIAIAVLALLDTILFIWLAYNSGRINGLTSEVKRSPGILGKLSETINGKSALHLPPGFEKMPREDDERNA